MGRYRTSIQAGLSTIELLVTLLVAGLFIASGFSLYSFVIQDSGTTRADARASSVATQYLEQNLTYSGVCAVSNTTSNPTVEGLSDVEVEVDISCPNGVGDPIARLTVTVTYNNPPKTMTIARDIGPDSAESSGSDETSEYNIGWFFASTAPATPSFYWTAIEGATSYDIEYRVNGGSWTSGGNTTNTTYSYVASEVFRGDTVGLRVTAKSGSTALSNSTATATIPSWNRCNLQNDWTDYHPAWSSAEFTKTSAGVVMMRGMIKAGNTTSGTVICTLPVGFRPDNSSSGGTLIFFTATGGTTAGRLDIDTSGNILYRTGNTAWESLSAIIFSAGNTAWLTPTASNGWVNYDGVSAGYADVRYKSDSLGRTYIQGLAKNGSPYTGYSSVAYTLPGSYAPSSADIYPSYTCAGGNTGSFYINTSAQVIPRNLPTNGCWSLQAILYPSSYTGEGGWQGVTPPAGWQNYGGSYSNAGYIKSGDGVVSLRGLIVNASNGETLFTLPAGYRPSKSIICYAVTNPETFARLDVGADGTVISREGTNASWLSLAGCDFMAEQ